MREPKIESINEQNSHYFKSILRQKEREERRRSLMNPRNYLKSTYEKVKSGRKATTPINIKRNRSARKPQHKKNYDISLENFIKVYNDLDNEDSPRRRILIKELMNQKQVGMAKNRSGRRIGDREKKKLRNINDNIDLIGKLNGVKMIEDDGKARRNNQLRKELDHDNKREEFFSYLVPPSSVRKKKKEDENIKRRKKKPKEELQMTSRVKKGPEKVIFLSTAATVTKKSSVSKADLMGCMVEKGFDGEVMKRIEMKNQKFKANLNSSKDYIEELYKRAREAEKTEGKLVVYVSHAKGLICRNVKNRIEKRYNPFVTLDVDNTPQGTTKKIDKTSCPLFKDLFEIDLSFEEKKKPKFVNFKVYDNEKLDVANKNGIGLVRVNLEQLLKEPEKWIVDGTYDIKKGPNMDRMNNETYFGDLYLQAAWVPKGRKIPRFGNLKKVKRLNSTTDKFKNGQVDNDTNRQMSPEESKREKDFVENVIRVEENRPRPKEDLEKTFGGNEFIKGTISTKVLFATDLKPPLEDIDEKINFSLDTFVEIEYPNDKSKKTRVIESTPFPIWNQFMNHQCTIKRDEMKPLTLKVKSSKGNLIGQVNIKFEDLLENENEWHINGVYDLENQQGDKTGSKIYLQAVYNTYGSDVDVKQIEFSAPKPSMDIDKYLSENKGMGIVAIKLLAFSIPRSLTERKLDPYMKIYMPGGGEYHTTVESDARFGYFGNLTLDRISYQKHKDETIKIKIYDYEVGTEDDELIAVDELAVKKIFRLANRWGYNIIQEVKLTPKYDRMMQENIKKTIKRNVKVHKSLTTYQPHVNVALVVKFIPDKKDDKKEYEDSGDVSSEESSSDFDDDVDYCVGEDIMRDIMGKYKDIHIEGNLYFHVHKLINVKDAEGNAVTKDRLLINLKFPDKKKSGFSTKKKKGKEIFFNERSALSLVFPRDDDDLEIIVELSKYVNKKTSDVLGSTTFPISPLFKQPGTYAINNYIVLKDEATFAETGRVYIQLKWVNTGGEDIEFYPLIHA